VWKFLLKHNREAGIERQIALEKAFGLNEFLDWFILTEAMTNSTFYPPSRMA